MSNDRQVNAETPLEERPPKIDAPAQAAGGVPAVVSTLRKAVGEMGILRSLRVLKQVNQKDGFDCPSCAWPDPEERHLIEFCENGAKAVADEATLKLIDEEFFKTYSVRELSHQTDHWLAQQGRLTRPMLLDVGSEHYRPVEWDTAFRLIADELNSLASPDEAVFYASGRTSNEAAFLYQLFVRQFGTNNLPDCSDMCHESSGRAMMETLGVGKGTVTLKDFELADAIFVIGQNPGTNHPRMLATLQQAVRRGCRIVAINPLPEAGLIRFKHPQELSGLLGWGTPLASLFLQVRINGDVALLKGIMKHMLETERRQPGSVFSLEFIDCYTTGYREFIDDLDATSWDLILEQSGISREEISKAAEIAISSERMIVCWAMGLTQHRNAVANIQQIVNLLLLRGQFGKPGAGACPVRGHSNVQGDRTMGIWEYPTKQFLDRLEQVFNFKPPQKPGYDTVAAIKAMHEGKVKVFIALGGNFLSATPDTRYTAEALRRCSLTVQISTKLNRSHLVTGKRALILPCLGRTEIDLQASGPQFVTVEDSMSVVHPSRGWLPPASAELLSEPAIVARLAEATLGARSNVRWRYLVEDYDRIRDLIEQTIPGFEDYNRRVRAGGFYLENPTRKLKFNTPDGKARFTVHPIPIQNLRPGQYLMMTVRSHDQFNTTVYGLEDRYRGVKGGRRVVFLNPEDVKEAGLRPGQMVDLISSYDGIERIARGFRIVEYQIPRRCAATYFPEANVLVPVDAVAEKSNTPASKSIVITIRQS